MLAGKLPVIVHADDVRQITAAVAFADEEKLKLIIAGGYDAPRVSPPAQEARHAGDRRRRLSPAAAAGRRLRRGLRAARAAARRRAFASASPAQGRFGASNVRNLPYHAATAVAFGLPADEALKAITLYPAQILGVADRVGSLEVGKDATLFVADGDPLDTPTQVEAAWIQGRKVELNDRHKRLYRKYEEKYKQLAP